MGKRKFAMVYLVILICLLGMSSAVFAAPSPSISTKKVTIVVGNSKKIAVKNARKKVRWRSSRPSVARVNANGSVTALKKGKTVITATVAGKKYTCRVSVIPAKLNVSKMALSIHGSKKLKFTNSRGKVKWSSIDKAIAKVSSAGKVTGVNVGKTTITAKIGTATYRCQVTVNEPDVETHLLEFSVTDGGEFIRGSTASINFSMKKEAYNVKVWILNTLGEQVYSKTYDKCSALQVYDLSWEPSLSLPSGSYRVLVKAGKKENYSEYLSLKESGEFAGGNGSKSNPYLVSTLEQFKAVELHNGFYYKQVNDIDGGKEMISGIYSADNLFTGNYDGGGYTIRNLILKNDTKDSIALFGGVGDTGSIRNLMVSDIDVIGEYNMASVLSLSNYGSINNCSVINCTVNDTYEYEIKSAFLSISNMESGQISGCSIRKCSAALKKSTTRVNGIFSGGLVVDNYGKILDCSVDELNIHARLVYEYQFARLSGLVRWNKGYMQNCSALNSTVDSNYQPGESTGGICQLNEGVIRDCAFSGTAINTGIDENNGTVVSN